MFSAGRRNYWIERGPDGRLREARDAPAEPEARYRSAEKRPADDEVIIEVAPASPHIDAREARLRDNLPSFSEVDRLLNIFVATGQGHGAFAKAKKQVQEEARRRFFEHYYGGHDDDFYDGFPDYGGGPGPGGGPPGLIVVDRRPYSSRLSRSRRRPPGDRLDSHSRHHSESSRSDSDNDRYPSSGKRPNRPSGGGPSTNVEGEHNVVRNVPTASGPSLVLSRRPERRAALQVSETRPDEIVPVNPLHERRHVIIHQEEDVAEEQVLRPVRMSQRYQQARRSMQPTVQDVSEDEDEVALASLPSEEDDLRMQPPDRYEQQDNHAVFVRRRRDQNHRLDSVRRLSPNRRHSRRVIIRGGGGPEHTFEEDPSRSLGRRVRLRGGGVANPPTKTSAVGADVLDDYNRASKPIALFFFSINRGRIISSHRKEHYWTFRELYPPRVGVPTDLAHRSDVWLVDRLRTHYWMICRRGQRTLWDLVSMRTVGFATFIRFERTVKRSQDPGNYFVTALAPAISAEGQEAVSHFVYLMNNPLQRSKMMLFMLDRLAGSTKWANDHNAFYAVEIKETFDTRKIYIVLFLLILISTGAGVAYAVVRSDPSTGLSIASYILTCLSLILAVVAAGEWLGLTKPDAFSFAYDWVQNRVVSKEDVDNITAGRWSRMP